MSLKLRFIQAGHNNTVLEVFAVDNREAIIQIPLTDHGLGILCTQGLKIAYNRATHHAYTLKESGEQFLTALKEQLEKA